MKTEKTIFRKRKNIKLYKIYNYTGLYGARFLNVKLYDKITKTFYSGNIEACGDSYQKMKEQEEDYQRSIK